MSWQQTSKRDTQRATRRNKISSDAHGLVSGRYSRPPPVNMSKTYMAAFFVIALLAGGVFLVWEATGGLLPEIVATIGEPASELSPR